MTQPDIESPKKQSVVGMYF